MRIKVSPFGLHPNQFLQDFNVPYHPELPISYLFSLLSKERNWKTNSRTWRKNWNKCMACEYDRLIGYCNTNLETWQELCRQVGIEGSFMSITKCKKALAGIHVNIIDVLDCWNTDDVPRRFASVRQLAEYTKKTNKTFNRHVAKQDKILRILLRRIF
ncbi:hypothetical protein PENARI_c044G00615 [Penicillium arizonense]|uniref:Uncharacterized protein n=1 Tax=Penicillium arizonense TaxID=1835702 RepID=A0A1F5L377_PENAI|nr:hypothetical protein PENARI_c044G00615 [Penicillium arizonense]OGE47450.1 hypothetical protein PENARI_c044G00615 [Penicillium arizonense]